MACRRKRIYVKKRKEIPGLPWLPIVTDESEPPSIYVQNAYANTPYPLLLMKKSWTKAVPYRDSFEYTKPSDSIGCSFSPAAQRMNIHMLPPQKKEPFECPIPESGQLGYPSKEWAKMIDHFDKIYAKKKSKEESPFVVSLQDLCSGEYYERKKKMTKRRKIEKPKETLSQYLAKVEIEISQERMYGLIYF